MTTSLAAVGHVAPRVRVMAVADKARKILDAASVTPPYRAAMATALTLPGNVLSGTPNVRWARLVWTCCTAAGGTWERAIPVSAAVEIFLTALDVLDDVEDGEVTPLHTNLGGARTLNVSTGLLLLAQQSLLDDAGPIAAGIVQRAGLIACAGQHADLAPVEHRRPNLNESLAVTAEKSASLVAAVCRLGALHAGARAPLQELYAHYGWCLGMVLQLVNDIAAIKPGTDGKTDALLERPTLPLTHAARLRRLTDARVRDDDAGTALWTGGPAYLAWTVADTYRRHALDVVPRLTSDAVARAALTGLLQRR